jgi:hypothetical protein
VLASKARARTLLRTGSTRRDALSPPRRRAFAMRINPLPFIFAPGVALGGYLVDGLHGTWVALLGWSAIVLAGTLCAYLLRR